MPAIRRRDGRRAPRPLCKVCDERHSVRGEIAIEVYGITRHICRRCVAKMEKVLVEKKKEKRRIIT